MNNLTDRVRYSHNDNNTFFAVSEFRDLDDVLNNFNNLSKNEQRLAESSKKWTFGSIGEKLTDKLLKNGDVVDDIYKYVEDYKQELEGTDLDDLKTKVKSCVRKRKFSEEGYDFDLSRILNGDSDYRINVTQEGKKHFVTIGIQITLSCGNGEKQFAKNTAIAVVLCELLEELGYGVRVVALASVYGQIRPKGLKSLAPSIDYNKLDSGDSETGHMFVLIRAEDTMDIRQISCTALSGLLRKYTFAFDRICYGGISGTCMESSNEYLNFCGIDLLVSTQWSKGELGSQTESITKAVTDFIDSL